MEKRTYVMGDGCSVCHNLKPRVEKAAEKSGATLDIVLFDEIQEKESILTVPTLIINDSKYLTDSDLVNYIRP